MVKKMLTQEQQQQLILSIANYLKSKKPWFGSWWGKTPNPLLDDNWVNTSFNNHEQKTYVRAFFTDERHKKSIKRYFDKGNIFFNVLYNIFRVLQVVTGWIFGWGEDLFLKKVKKDFSGVITVDPKKQADEAVAAEKLKQELDLDRQKKEVEAAANLKQEEDRKKQEAEAGAKIQAQLEQVRQAAAAKRAAELEIQKKKQEEEERKRQEEKKRQEELEQKAKQDNDNLHGFDEKEFGDVPPVPVIDEETLVAMNSFYTYAQEMYRDEVSKNKQFQEDFDNRIKSRIQERITMAEELGLVKFLDKDGFISQDFLNEGYRIELLKKAISENKQQDLIEINVAVSKIPAFNDFLKEQSHKIEIDNMVFELRKQGILDDAHLGNLLEKIEEMRSKLDNHDFTDFYESACNFYLIMMNSSDDSSILKEMLFEVSGLREDEGEEKLVKSTLKLLASWMEYSKIWNNNRAALEAYESHVLSLRVSVIDDLNMTDSAQLRGQQFDQVKGPLLKIGFSQKNVMLDDDDNPTVFYTIEQPITLQEFIIKANQFFSRMIKNKKEEIRKKQQEELKNINEEIKVDEEVKESQEELDKRERIRVEDDARSFCGKKLASLSEALDLEMGKVNIIRASYFRLPLQDKDNDLREKVVKILKIFQAIKSHFSEKDLSNLGVEKINQLSEAMETVQKEIQNICIDFQKKDAVTNKRVQPEIEVTRILQAIEAMGIEKLLSEDAPEPGSSPEGPGF
jgi:hypothetical protein